MDLALFSSNKVLGLDVGSSSIKIAELDVGRSGAKLINFGMIPTPANSINGGDFVDSNAISFAIQSLKQEVRASRTLACIGMFGTSVIVKKITIPRIDIKLVAEQVRWEAEQYIPFDPASISLEHKVINPKGTSETMEILLIAAQNEMVAAYNGIVTGSGLKLGVLDVSAFALANLFELNYGQLKGQTVALLNVGSSLTNFVVVTNGEIVFSRDMPVGGQNYTNDLQKEMGVTFSEAESLKLSASTGGTVPDEVTSSLNATNEIVSEEIRNSFDFFSGSSDGTSISQVYFTGGGAASPGLIKQLAQVTHLKFDWLNPFLKVVSGNKKYSASYIEKIAPFSSIAMGLGLRKVGDA
jgi:type IV pilus assembly protein PilM